MFKLILLLSLIFCETGFAKTEQPKHLWKREFKTEINALALSKDSSKIALTVKPEIKEYKEDKDKNYYDDKRMEWFGSKLYYFDNKGKVLWEYEAKKMEELDNVVMSENGDYIACSVKELITEDREIGYYIGSSGKYKYEIKKWQE